jgi:hypothetical protein
MASLLEDQAAGLRKLFAGARGPTRIAFAGREADGRGALVAALARGLAAAGKEVLLIDEPAGAASAAAALRPALALRPAAGGEPRRAGRAGAAAAPNRHPAAAGGARRCAVSPPRRHAERRALAEWLRRQQGQADFVLGEARAGARRPIPVRCCRSRSASSWR